MERVKSGRRTLWGITKPIDKAAAVSARRFMRFGSAFNVKVFRLSRGWLMSRWRVGRRFIRGVPVCLLTTMGRKSGLERTVPLLYLPWQDGVVIVASQGGLPRHPDWYFNITANPRVRIERRGHTFDGTAEVAEESLRAELWPRLLELYPSFAVYQARAGREIPVVVCRPD